MPAFKPLPPESLSSSLTPRQKAAFVLRDIEGLDTAEVARILDLRESTVRNHLMRARRVLREGLKREYPELVRDLGGEEES